MLRVLLVDDETFFRQGLRAIVDWQACGYEVIGEEDNGEDAFQFIMKERPDVVITDIRMPEVDGLELIHKVVQEEKLNTKFIIVSGYDEFKYAQQAVRYGVCDFCLSLSMKLDWRKPCSSLLNLYIGNHASRKNQ